MLFTLRSFLLFQGFPVASSLILTLAGLHADLWNIFPNWLFVSITAIHKRFICVRFYLRARAGQSRNVNIHKELALWNINFKIFVSYEIWTLLIIREHVIITTKPQSFVNCHKLFKISSKQEALMMSQNKLCFRNSSLWYYHGDEY